MSSRQGFRGRPNGRRGGRRPPQRNMQDGETPTRSSDAPPARSQTQGLSLDANAQSWGPAPRTQPSAQGQGNWLSTNANRGGAASTGRPPFQDQGAPQSTAPEQQTPEQPRSTEPPGTQSRSSELRRRRGAAMNDSLPRVPLAPPAFNNAAQGATDQSQSRVPPVIPTGPATARPARGPPRAPFPAGAPTGPASMRPGGRATASNRQFAAVGPNGPANLQSVGRGTGQSRGPLPTGSAAQRPAGRGTGRPQGRFAPAMTSGNGGQRPAGRGMSQLQDQVPPAAPGARPTGRPAGQPPNPVPTVVPTNPATSQPDSGATVGAPPTDGATAGQASASTTTETETTIAGPAANGTTANGTTASIAAGGTTDTQPRTGYQGRNDTSTNWDQDWSVLEPTWKTRGITRDSFQKGDVFSMPYHVQNDSPRLTYPHERRLRRTCEGYVYSKRRMFVVIYKHKMNLVCMPLGTRSERGIESIDFDRRDEYACVRDLGTERTATNPFLNGSSNKTIDFNKASRGTRPISDNCIIDLTHIVTTHWDHDMRYVGRVTRASHWRLVKYHRVLVDKAIGEFVNWLPEDGPEGSP